MKSKLEFLLIFSKYVLCDLAHLAGLENPHYYKYKSPITLWWKNSNKLAAANVGLVLKISRCWERNDR
jgi:hypothetical protein